MAENFILLKQKALQIRDEVEDSANSAYRVGGLFKEIVDVFEQMCSTPLEEDMVLFETGTFTAFSKEPFFQISLVRQFSNDEEEFYQIHVVILYKPTAENKIFSETTWDEDLDENIFDYIRKSASFAYARNHEYIEVKIYMDET